MEDEDALTDDNTSRNPRKEIPLPRGAEPAADRRGNVFGTRKLTDSAAVYDHNAWLVTKRDLIFASDTPLLSKGTILNGQKRTRKMRST